MSDVTDAYEAIRKEIKSIRESLADERMKYSTAMDVDEALCAIETYALDLFLTPKKAETP